MASWPSRRLPRATLRRSISPAGRSGRARWRRISASLAYNVDLRFQPAALPREALRAGCSSAIHRPISIHSTTNRTGSRFCCVSIRRTGKTLWRHVRKSDAVGESQESYATPLPYEGTRGTEIVVFGGDHVTGHRADTGAEIWRCGSFNTGKVNVWRVITSPATSPGFIYLGLPKRHPFLAIKAGAIGHVTPDAQTAWKLDDLMPDVCTPLTYRGKLFVLDGDKQLLACLDPKTGEKKWQGSIGKKETFSASPTGADGKIYCIGERGTIVVLSAGDEFKILASFTTDEIPVLSSIVAANGRLFVRTAQNLYCIGGTKK